MAEVRGFRAEDVPAMMEIWNRVVRDGEAFPQTEEMTETEAAEFFAGQSFTAVAEDGGEITGLYILHPNNIGRCGHIANASYAVKYGVRGKGVGEALVRHSLEKGAELGFRILQFNAVVRSNVYAVRLYEKLGFTKLGLIPGGFRKDDGTYEDIFVFIHAL